MKVLQVDVVVPVRNEERDLVPSIRRLVAYLRESFPFTARVTIADNGSTDATWALATGLARELAEVRAVHMELPGRGRALRATSPYLRGTRDTDALNRANMEATLSRIRSRAEG